MKRLLVVTMIALVPAVCGCRSAWPRTAWYRGDSCQTCAPTYGTTSAPVMSAPVYDGTMLPSPPIATEIPSPVAPTTP